MTLLLDSHFAFWVALSPSSLTAQEHALLSDPTARIRASSVSLWELRIKWEKKFASGERKGPADPSDILKGLQVRGIEIEPLTAHHAVARLKALVANRDPFDEQLLIHAQELGAKLLTRDEKLIGHPLVYVPA